MKCHFVTFNDDSLVIIDSNIKTRLFEVKADREEGMVLSSRCQVESAASISNFVQRIQSLRF